MEYQTIELTQAARKHGNLNLSRCGRHFFPDDVFDPPSKNEGLGEQISIRAFGLNEIIKTDIPTYRKTGKPRLIFRERSWVKEFVRYHNLKPNDKVRINRVNNSTYKL